MHSGEMREPAAVVIDQRDGCPVLQAQISPSSSVPLPAHILRRLGHSGAGSLVMQRTSYVQEGVWSFMNRQASSGIATSSGSVVQLSSRHQAPC